MSIEALNYAIRVGDRLGAMNKKRITPTEALLLVHLCNHVDGQWRWESDKGTLARRCITTPRTIQTGLNKFQDWGLMSLRRHVGHRGQDAEGFEFWVHEQNLKVLAEDPEGFFTTLDSGSEDISTPRNGGSENISHPETDLWITGSENSSTPGNSGEENISTLAGSEKFARSDVENFHPQRVRASFKPSREPSYSSSSPPHSQAERVDSTGSEPPADAAGDEEPLPGAIGESKPPSTAAGGSLAASGRDTTTGDGPPTGGISPNDPRISHRLGEVAGQKVISKLSAVDAAEVTWELAEAYVKVVLDRSTETTITRPTGFVLAAIGRSPSRTRADLAKLREDLARAITASGPGVGSKASRPALCPLPAHRDRGHRQATCPDCRGITGEFDFPEAVSQELFDRLTDWQQRNLADCGVLVRDQVEAEAMSKSILHHRRRQPRHVRRQSPYEAGERRDVA